MPKHQALALVEKCKRWIVVTSLVSFATLGALVLGNMPNTSANQATPATNPNSAAPIPTATPDDGSGFFQQPQGGGGFGFGSNNQFQGPASQSGGS